MEIRAQDLSSNTDLMLTQEQRVDEVPYSQGTCKGHVNNLVMHAWQGWRGNLFSGFHVLLDLSLGIDQDILEMVVRDKLIFIVSIPGKRPRLSQNRTPAVNVLEVWTRVLPAFAHECVQQERAFKSYGQKKIQKANEGVTKS